MARIVVCKGCGAQNPSEEVDYATVGGPRCRSCGASLIGCAIVEADPERRMRTRPGVVREDDVELPAEPGFAVGDPDMSLGLGEEEIKREVAGSDEWMQKGLLDRDETGTGTELQQLVDWLERPRRPYAVAMLLAGACVLVFGLAAILAEADGSDAAMWVFFGLQMLSALALIRAALGRSDG
jgi:hypothetical protein